MLSAKLVTVKPDPKKNYPEYLFHTALTAGIPWGDVGGLTIGDIAMAAQVHKEKHEEFAQLLTWVMYNSAALTGIAINDPKNFPKIEDAFPSLFEQKEQQGWQVIKARVEHYSLSKRNALLNSKEEKTR